MVTWLVFGFSYLRLTGELRFETAAGSLRTVSLLIRRKGHDRIDTRTKFNKFISRRDEGQSKLRALWDAGFLLSSPKTAKTRSRHGDSLGVLVSTHPLYWI